MHALKPKRPHVRVGKRGILELAGCGAVGEARCQKKKKKRAVYFPMEASSYCATWRAARGNLSPT